LRPEGSDARARDSAILSVARARHWWHCRSSTASPYRIHILSSSGLVSLTTSVVGDGAPSAWASLGHGGFMAVGADFTALTWNYGTSPLDRGRCRWSRRGSAALVSYPASGSGSPSLLRLVTLALSGIGFFFQVSHGDARLHRRLARATLRSATHGRELGLGAAKFHVKTTWYLIALAVPGRAGSTCGTASTQHASVRARAISEDGRRGLPAGFSDRARSSISRSAPPCTLSRRA